MYSKNLFITKGTTSYTSYVYLANATTGGTTPRTGLAYTNITCYAVRSVSLPVRIITNVQTPLGTFTDGGFCEVDAVNLPGVYRLDLPDSVLASGTNTVTIQVIAPNAVPVIINIQLISVNFNDSVRAGLTSLPNTAIGTSGGLPIADSNNAVKIQSGTGPNQISLSSGQVTVGTCNDKGNYYLSALGNLNIADAVKSRPLVESYANLGALPSTEQMLFQIWSFLSQKTISGSTMTTKKLDGSTVCMSFALNSPTQPSSITRSS